MTFKEIVPLLEEGKAFINQEKGYICNYNDLLVRVVGEKVYFFIPSYDNLFKDEWVERE